MKDLYALINSAAHSGAFGINGCPEPSVANLRAGNYRKGRVTLHGLPVAIETPQGRRRAGKEDGQPWSVICQAHYGYIAGVKGADGDDVDVFIGPWPESERVYVVNRSARDGSFDEHKVLLGFVDQDSAVTAYTNSYERGSAAIMSVVPCDIDQFKWWLKFGNKAVALAPNHLPYGNPEMNNLIWDSTANPVGFAIPELIYQMRRDDADGLMLDSVSVADVLEDSDGELMLDALVIPMNQLERKLGQLQVIMRAAGNELKPVAMQVTPPFKQRGTTNVAGIIELSDGQTISIYFHNPDTTPNKLTPDDEMVSWKWLLNKKDVTIVVAPERGRDLNPREVGRRVMKLAEANSARFQRANENRVARMAAIEAGKTEIEQLGAKLESLNAEIERLTPLAEAKRANEGQTPAPSQEGAGSTGTVSPAPTAVESVTLVWSEGSADTNRTFPSMDHLHGWFLATFEPHKIPRDGTYRKNKLRIVFTGEHAGPHETRVDVGHGRGDFDPHTQHISSYLAENGIPFMPVTTGVVRIDVQDDEDDQGDFEARMIEHLVAEIRGATGTVARLPGAQYATFDFEGEDMILTDDMKAKVEAALGEPVKEVNLPGFDVQLSLVPQSWQPAKQVDSEYEAAEKKFFAKGYTHFDVTDNFQIASATGKDLAVRVAGISKVFGSRRAAIIYAAEYGKGFPGRVNPDGISDLMAAASAMDVAGMLRIIRSAAGSMEAVDGLCSALYDRNKEAFDALASFVIPNSEEAVTWPRLSFAIRNWKGEDSGDAGDSTSDNERKLSLPGGEVLNVPLATYPGLKVDATGADGIPTKFSTTDGRFTRSVMAGDEWVKDNVAGVLVSQMYYLGNGIGNSIAVPDDVRNALRKFYADVDAAVSAAKAAKKAVVAPGMVINPKFAHLSPEEIKRLEKEWDARNNEGGEGFNPYRDNLYVEKSDGPLDEARAYLQSVIDGSIDLNDLAVADKLGELYETHNGNAEFDALFAKAADAYQEFMVAAASAAMK